MHLSRLFFMRVAVGVTIVFLMGAAFVLASPKVTYAAPLVAPSCTPNTVTDLSGASFAFRAHPTCSGAVDSLRDIISAQASPNGSGGLFSTINGSTNQETCSGCTALLNPIGGGFVSVGVGNFPGGTCFRAIEVVSWTTGGETVSGRSTSLPLCK